jgi:hypothetical protein
LTEKQTKALRLGLTMAVCLVISRLSVGALVFAVPLLVSAGSLDRPWKKVVLFLVEMVGVIAWELVASIGAFSTSVVILTAFFPCMICLCCMCYEALEQRMSKVYRTVASSLLCCLLLGLFSLWFSKDAIAMQYVDTMLEVSFQLTGMSEAVDQDAVKNAMVLLLSHSVAGAGCAALGFNILFSESVLAARQARLDWGSDIRLPEYFIWAFLGSWALALFSYLGSWNVLVSSVCWNLALVISVFYAVQGASIVCFWQRKRNERATMQALLSLMMLLAFIPGANALVVAGLPLLGVLETWIGFRKNKDKEISL